MKDINLMVNDIAENIIEITGFEKVSDIKAVLYMHLSGYTIVEECTELTTSMDDLADAVENYVTEMQLQGFTEGTIRTYGSNLKNFFEFTNKGLRDIHEADVKRYLAHGKTKKKWKDKTYNNKLRSIRAFFRFCYEYDLVPNDPCKRIKDLREEHIMQSILTPEQREIVRCCCKSERELALVDMLYSSGMRVSEVVGLNRQDIDFTTRHMICYGKGKKEREIMFSHEAAVHLKNYLSQRTDDNEALFVWKKRPYNRLGKCGIEHLLMEIKSRDPRLKNVSLTPHVYRRTRGTDLINRGMPAELVAQKFGHESVQTLLDCYAAISNKTVWTAEEKCG